ncbi:hypothetical protein HGM15179_019591, partial [Zosterops borbonicus]
FRGEKWKTNVLLTALLCPGIVFADFFVMNLILWVKGSSAAIPFGTLVAILAMWFGISVPLTFVGAYFGFKEKTVTQEKGTKYEATVSTSTQTVTEEKETKGAVSISTQTVTELEQPKPAAVAPVQKKTSRSKSVHIMTDEDAAGPSQPAEETEIEIITRSLSLGELRDLRREFIRPTNESILTWLLRIWDAAANDSILDGIEARQLGSLSRDVVIDQGIGRTQETLSLLQQLLTSVKDIPL